MDRLVLMIAFFLAATGLSAQERGPYVGVGVGLFSLEDEDAGLSFDDSAPALNLYGGYRFGENFGAELTYLKTAEMSDDILGIDVDADVSAISARALGFVPVGANLDLFAGAGLWSGEIEFEVPGASGSEDDDGFMVTGGIRGRFDTISVQGSFDWFDSDSDSTWQIGVTAFFHF